MAICRSFTSLFRRVAPRPIGTAPLSVLDTGDSVNGIPRHDVNQEPIYGRSDEGVFAPSRIEYNEGATVRKVLPWFYSLMCFSVLLILGCVSLVCSLIPGIRYYAFAIALAIGNIIWYRSARIRRSSEILRSTKYRVRGFHASLQEVIMRRPHAAGMYQEEIDPPDDMAPLRARIRERISAIDPSSHDDRVAFGELVGNLSALNKMDKDELLCFYGPTTRGDWFTARIRYYDDPFAAAVMACCLGRPLTLRWVNTLVPISISSIRRLLNQISPLVQNAMSSVGMPKNPQGLVFDRRAMRALVIGMSLYPQVDRIAVAEQFGCPPESKVEYLNIVINLALSQVGYPWIDGCVWGRELVREEGVLENWILDQDVSDIVLAAHQILRDTRNFPLPARSG